MALALPALLCFVCGLALVSAVLSRRSPLALDLMVRSSFAVGFGLGIFSVVFFLSRAFDVTNLLAVDLAVCVIVLISFFLQRNYSKALATLAPPTETLSLPRGLKRIFTAAFALSLCAALYSAMMRTLAHPHGDGWDAFSIWNLHARFLYRGGAHWRDGFSGLVPWSHPDYPLLLPGAIAHFWTCVGHDAPAVPAVIGLLFTFSTVSLLFSALFILRGRTFAMLGGLTLLTTPFFIEQGTSQYADVPLSFFLLATVTLLCLHDEHSGDSTGSRRPGLIVLAGLAAGFAAWTKNEGLLFLCAILAARLMILLRPERHRDSDPPTARKSSRDRMVAFATLLAAVAPAFLLIAWFKHFIAPPGDLFSDPATALHKLIDPSRYWAIMKWYGKGSLRFGHWLLLPGTLLLPALYLATRAESTQDRGDGFRSCRLALVLTLCGYFAIYLITPYEIYWHLRFSLARLFLQLWPSTIFLFFLTFPSGTETAVHNY
jgi:Dolichyl-phosphate-mannose-protein mannosyltransferase